MAMHMHNGTKRRRNRKPMSEINVTPFVDVMLVLLIVFMVTAPLLTVGVAVDLPETRANQITDEVTPVIITIRADGSLALQNRDIAPELLIPRLEAVEPDTRIFVRGDRAVPYGEVIAIMTLVQEAGFSRVALITRLPEG